MKIGFWELVVIVVIAFVFIGPDQLPVYAKKLGKMLRELKKYTGAASEEIQKNVVEPLNEIQAPLKEAVAPLTDIKKDIDNSVKDVTKSFTGIGKTSKEEAAKAEQAEEVTELEEVEELPEETPAEAPAAEAPKAEQTPAAEPVKAEEKTDAPAEAAPVAEEAAPGCRSRTCRRGKGLRSRFHKHCTPPERPFCSHSALLSLAIRQDCCGKSPCLRAKILAVRRTLLTKTASNPPTDAPAPAVALYIVISPPRGAAK